jgi:hypothetical protein
MSKAGHQRNVERASWDELYDQIQTVKSKLSFKHLCDTTSANILVLNAQMQIAFVSRGCLDLLKIQDPAVVYGCRIGEALQCIHANKQSGCGTAPFCRVCGVTRAWRTTLKGVATARNYSIRQLNKPQTLELCIHSKPIELEGMRYILLSLTNNQPKRNSDPPLRRPCSGPPFIADHRAARLLHKI